VGFFYKALVGGIDPINLLHYYWNVLYLRSP